MSCDLLVFAPHPDDAELHCGATIARATRLGRRVVVVDATAGELGSRGTVAGRAEEAAAAAAVLGLAARENLDLGDGRLDPQADTARAAVVDAIRRHRPHLVLGIHPHARHPDHQALGELVRAAVKLAAIHRFPGSDRPAWRDAVLAEYEAELPVVPTLLVPCTEDDRARKREALACHASQFGLDGGDGPDTAIADPAFLAWIDHRGRAWGHHARAPYAEALLGREPLSIKDLQSLG